MTLEEAIAVVDSKGISPWTAWGVYAMCGQGYVIADTSYMRRWPDIDYVYVRKGNMFPQKGFNRELPMDMDKSKLPYER